MNDPLRPATPGQGTGPAAVPGNRPGRTGQNPPEAGVSGLIFSPAAADRMTEARERRPLSGRTISPRMFTD